MTRLKRLDLAIQANPVVTYIVAAALTAVLVVIL